MLLFLGMAGYSYLWKVFQCWTCSFLSCWWSLHHIEIRDLAANLIADVFNYQHPFYAVSIFLEPMILKLILVFGKGVMMHVSMTFISNSVSIWGVQTPCIPRSALNPGPSARVLASLLVHNPITKLRFQISLCHRMTRPPFLQSNACWSLKQEVVFDIKWSLNWEGSQSKCNLQQVK